MFKITTLLNISVAALTLAAAPFALAGAARADACDRLWHKRNAIYADYGYCFKTERARSVFGYVCHPPFGRLPPWAQRRVSEIQAEEDGMGCPR